MKMIEQSFEVLTPIEEYMRFQYMTERIARVCYKSEDKMCEGSAERMIRQLVKSGHGAMLEHCNLTIKFITDRAVANEFVRHRHCAFAQESTHFIDYLKRGELTYIWQAETKSRTLFAEVLKTNAAGYNILENESKKVRRGFLPLCLKTELVITTNIREWRHILTIRTTPKAHPQMRALMRSVLDWFKEELPIFVEDIHYE